jgi:squalene synthase HpnC
MPTLATTLDDVLKAQGLTGAEDPVAHCRAMANSHDENFPVLSRAVPGRLQDAFAAVYAYCRAVDDLGDEAEGNRLALLDAWEEDLLKLWGGEPRHPILRALGPVVRAHGIPPGPFRRLVRANRMDQMRNRYATFEEVREYCRHSADPVGHLVLHLYGHRDAGRQLLSDAVCTGLQLANFWQDVARDLAGRNRIYLPREDLERFGVSEADLSQRSATPALRELMAFEVSRARTYFSEGAPLVDRLAGRSRWVVSAFIAGGLAVLDALADQGYDPLSKRPGLPSGAKRRLLAGTAIGLFLGRRGASLFPSSRRADRA